MVSLGVSGIVLFGVSVAALAAPDSYQTRFFEGTWRGLSSRDKQVWIPVDDLVSLFLFFFLSLSFSLSLFLSFFLSLSFSLSLFLSLSPQSIQDHFDCCGFNNESRHIVYGDHNEGCDKGCNGIAHPLCYTSALTGSDVRPTS